MTRLAGVSGIENVLWLADSPTALTRHWPYVAACVVHVDTGDARGTPMSPLSIKLEVGADVRQRRPIALWTAHPCEIESVSLNGSNQSRPRCPRLGAFVLTAGVAPTCGPGGSGSRFTTRAES